MKRGIQNWSHMWFECVEKWESYRWTIWHWWMMILSTGWWIWNWNVKHIVIVLIIFVFKREERTEKNNEQLGNLTRRKQVATPLNWRAGEQLNEKSKRNQKETKLITATLLTDECWSSLKNCYIAKSLHILLRSSLLNDIQKKNENQTSNFLSFERNNIFNVTFFWFWLWFTD